MHVCTTDSCELCDELMCSGFAGQYPMDVDPGAQAVWEAVHGLDPLISDIPFRVVLETGENMMTLRQLGYPADTRGQLSDNLALTVIPAFAARNTDKDVVALSIARGDVCTLWATQLDVWQKTYGTTVVSSDTCDNGLRIVQRVEVRALSGDLVHLEFHECKEIDAVCAEVVPVPADALWSDDSDSDVSVDDMECPRCDLRFHEGLCGCGHYGTLSNYADSMRLYL
jgi:hypothetical protein